MAIKKATEDADANAGQLSLDSDSLIEAINQRHFEVGCDTATISVMPESFIIANGGSVETVLRLKAGTVMDIPAGQYKVKLDVAVGGRKRVASGVLTFGEGDRLYIGDPCYGFMADYAAWDKVLKEYENLQKAGNYIAVVTNRDGLMRCDVKVTRKKK